MNLSKPSMRNTLSLSVLATALFLSSSVVAEHHGHDEHKEGHAETEQHGAHEHGAARLTLAVTEQGLEIALESPAANLLGFEHMPSSDADKATLAAAVKTLNGADKIFLANAAAGCKAVSTDIDSALLEDEHHDDHKDEHKDDHDDHKDEHKDDHDDHKDEHKDHHDDHKGESEGTHNDMDVTWKFACKDISEIKQVDVKLFSAFPKGFSDLDVEWISSSSAGSVELESDGVVQLTP